MESGAYSSGTATIVFTQCKEVEIVIKLLVFTQQECSFI